MDFFLDFFFAHIGTAIDILFFTMPVWLPFGLAILLYDLWVQYAREKFFSSQEYVLLEIRLPQEVLRSPAAMELALIPLHITGGEGTWFDRYILGKTRPWFSLEIASIEGHLHFFVWTRKNLKDIVEAAFYAQYPGIEIFEAADYTDFAPFYSPEQHGVFGMYYKLTKEDAYPIKTYIDYGLDKDPKEEYKYDPLTTVLEFMGNIGKGEQMWFQIICRANKGNSGGIGFSDYDWKKKAAALLEELEYKYRGQKKGEPYDMSKSRLPLKSETALLEAVQRSLTKVAFDCGFRFLYIAEKKNFKPAQRNTAIGALLKPFNSGTLNDFVPEGVTAYDYPWQDFQNMRVNGLKRKLVTSYRRRAYFFPPFRKKAHVLTSEELATIFHFPGKVSQTPLLERLPSRKAEPPANLPL